MQNAPTQLQVRADDATMKGSYANMMQVTHSQEEFVLDYFNAFPPQAQLVARVITSPGHLKRIIAALEDNLKRYEAKYGPVRAADAPENEVGFKAV